MRSCDQKGRCFMTDGFAVFLVLATIVALVLIKITNHGDYEEETFLLPGTYLVGFDIKRGKGDLRATTGAGNFIVKNRAAKDWQIGSPLGVTSGIQPSRFRNLILHTGDILEINGNVGIMITPPERIQDPSKEPLGAGIYRFGLDVPEGRYDLEVVSGNGDVLLVDVKKDNYVFFQDMSMTNSFKPSTFNNIVCDSKFELWVNGDLQIKLNPSNKQLRYLWWLLP